MVASGSRHCRPKCLQILLIEKRSWKGGLGSSPTTLSNSRKTSTTLPVCAALKGSEVRRSEAEIRKSEPEPESEFESDLKLSAPSERPSVASLADQVSRPGAVGEGTREHACPISEQMLFLYRIILPLENRAESESESETETAPAAVSENEAGTETETETEKRDGSRIEKYQSWQLLLSGSHPRPRLRLLAQTLLAVLYLQRGWAPLLPVLPVILERTPVWLRHSMQMSG